MIKLVNFFKKPVVTAGALSLALVSGAASANFDNVKFYAGAGLGYSKYGLSKEVKDRYDVKKSKGANLLVPVLGVKFHENFGMEFGMSFNKKMDLGKKTFETKTTTDLNIKVRNYYLDFMGFMPVCDNVELIGGVGLGRFTMKANNGSKGNHPFNLRVKAGAQYNFTNNFGVRGLVSYQNIGSKMKLLDAAGAEIKTVKFVKNMKSIGVDAIYSF